MEKERKIEITPGGQAPANLYDDGNIPKEDLLKLPDIYFHRFLETPPIYQKNYFAES